MERSYCSGKVSEILWWNYVWIEKVALLGREEKWKDLGDNIFESLEVARVQFEFNLNR